MARARVYTGRDAALRFTAIGVIGGLAGLVGRKFLVGACFLVGGLAAFGIGLWLQAAAERSGLADEDQQRWKARTLRWSVHPVRTTVAFILVLAVGTGVVILKDRI